jgi:hypothetical protein
LPSRIGSGFVFHVVKGGTTNLWRAATWTAPLVPLARLPFEAAEVEAGFDRLYVVSARTRGIVGLDAVTGAPIGEGALPRAPAYGGLAVADGWVGAVETDIRGALVTFDAGDTFHATGLPLAQPGVFEQSGRVVLGTKQGAFALLSSGGLERIDGPQTDAAFGDSNAENSRATDEDAQMDQADEIPAASLGGAPLEVAALRGFPDSPNTAVVVANSTFARIDLAEGRVLSSVLHAVPSGTDCQAIPFGKGIGFVCGGSGAGTVVYRYTAPTTLEPALSFPDARVVSPNGTGALAIAGGCSGATSPARYCVVSTDGKPREIEVHGDTRSARVVALSDGSAVVLVPPRFGALGSITHVKESGETESHALVLDAMPGDTQRLVARSLWLAGASESAPGKVSTWVAGSHEYLGVTVGLDGKVLAGTVEQGVERAMLSGAFGLALDERGGGRETVNNGMTWSEISTPDIVEGSVDRASEHPRGCTPVGCGVGAWVRVGWGNKGGPTDLGMAQAPPDTKFPPAPIVMWSFECAPTGEAEGAPETAVPPRRLAVRRVHDDDGSKPSGLFSDLESSAFRPFLGHASPSVEAGDLYFDFGTEDQPIQARGYAWGGRDAAWDRTGTWLVRVADRFSVRHAIWSTSPSRTPFADAGSAAEAFGSEPTHRITNEWRVALDPVDDGGLLFMRTGADTSLAVIERDRAITVVRNANEFPLDEANGTVKVGGRWYMGSVPAPRSFQILAIDAGVLSTVATYPRYTDDRDARLVRSVHGDALGIWVIGRGQHGSRSGGDNWFVYPLGPDAREAGPPVVIDHGALSRAPSPCEPDEDGWVIPYSISPSITKIDFSGTNEPPSLARLEARLVVHDGAVCLDALAAQVDGGPERDTFSPRASAKQKRSVELALTDRATDKRLGFRCAP